MSTSSSGAGVHDEQLPGRGDCHGDAASTPPGRGKYRLARRERDDVAAAEYGGRTWRAYGQHLPVRGDAERGAAQRRPADAASEWTLAGAPGRRDRPPLHLQLLGRRVAARAPTP